MLGAIAGDIIGSVYEAHPIKTMAFDLFSDASRFTDDTVLTVAIADAILNQEDYGKTLQTYGRKYPNAGYGFLFYNWLFSENRAPYKSWGNGSAMRVSPVGFAFDTIDKVLAEAERTAAVTHNHPHGIAGAQTIALSVFLARKGASKDVIRNEVSHRFGYDLDRTIAEIRPAYQFDVTCQGSVPEAIIAFLESADFEDAVRLAVSLGGDSDTLACMAGAVAQAYYQKIPEDIVSNVVERLPEEFVAVIDAFNHKFKVLG
ncbi:MAG: ADP-ribosylglycohydrolase family protein [Desulfobacteraceae bacterium]|nr:ADP-ribosylglycohydrolase family protein [Desulfobacteraceae bacterium]MBC2755078.1 ADP-ribosylglycohydrolase family protein [Desulfobacteraceae bacterium]